mmetsp:Transcript_93125/g.299784  ORF Transcript_93125/g.299784 Transcript_93125/m.299784 type:complete len:224 (+) Transcript_93125:469-1140(+)
MPSNVGLVRRTDGDGEASGPEQGRGHVWRRRRSPSNRRRRRGLHLGAYGEDHARSAQVHQLPSSFAVGGRLVHHSGIERPANCEAAEAEQRGAHGATEEQAPPPGPQQRPDVHIILRRRRRRGHGHGHRGHRRLVVQTQDAGHILDRTFSQHQQKAYARPMHSRDVHLHVALVRDVRRQNGDILACLLAIVRDDPECDVLAVSMCNGLAEGERSRGELTQSEA